jgi:multidrug transporter EmrE-like cation transporter
MSYAYVGSAILLMVYCQLVIKWQVTAAGAFPEVPADKLWFLLRLLLNPWILSALAAAFLAALTWMAALAKLDLSHAYPFVGLSFVLVALASAWLLHEPLTGLKIAGVALICLGVAIGSQG